MVRPLRAEESTSGFERDREQIRNGPSISASHRRPYAENDPQKDFRVWIEHNRIALRIALGAVTFVMIALFWFTAS